MSHYNDALAEVNQNLPITYKVKLIHTEIRRHHEFVDRIAVAIYEPECDLLKTFLCSCDDINALEFYQSRLTDSDSLLNIAMTHKPRVINDLSLLKGVNKVHSSRIAAGGYGSSYTTPIYSDGDFAGFVFLNSKKKQCFTDNTCQSLAPFVHLISLLTLRELELTKMLFGSVATALDISHHRDPETGAHLDRMSRYARLIANELAPYHGLDDEYVEYVFRFAPLHDIGKIAIPDSILLKPGRLTKEEFEVMKTHAARGRALMERMLENFNLHGIKHVEILLNLIEFHHEYIDGSGYPKGLRGDEIPLEARIIAVADIFDALTSRRPYKAAWSNEESFAELQQQADNNKLDKDCVEALLNNIKHIESIQRNFMDDPLG